MSDPVATHQPMAPELIQKFFDFQEKDIQLKGAQLELQKQKDSNSYEFAKAALSARNSDASAIRLHQHSILNSVLRFIAFMVLVFVAFMIYCLHSGNQEIAMQIIKGIGLIATGGFGGYGIGSRRRQLDKPQTNQSKQG